MGNLFKPAGSYVALVTPMTDSGEVDYTDLEKLVEFHLENKTDGLVVLGTTGEAVTVNDFEKESIVKRVISIVTGKIPVIVGTGHNCTNQTVYQTKLAQDWGADAALVVTPYYNKPSQAGLVAHYTTVANSVDIPIILYNVPGRTACDMLPDTVAELAKINGIVGLKEAVSTPERMNDLIDVCPDNFSLLSGDDASFLEFLKLGANGTISVTCNIVPDRIAAICAAARERHWQDAEQHNQKLLSLHQKLFVSSNPVPVKWGLFYMGLIKSPQCRLPLLALEQQYHAEVINALKEAGVSSADNNQTVNVG